MDKRVAFGGFGLLGLIILILTAALVIFSLFYLNIRTEKKLLDENFSKVEEQLLALKEDLAAKDRLLQCDGLGFFEPDYSGNRAMSTALITWVENYWSPVTENEWDVLWTNSATALHKIRGDFNHYFLVFYDESGQDFYNGVYAVGAQCWIDLPEEASN